MDKNRAPRDAELARRDPHQTPNEWDVRGDGFHQRTFLAVLENSNVDAAVMNIGVLEDEADPGLGAGAGLDCRNADDMLVRNRVTLPRTGEDGDRNTISMRCGEWHVFSPNGNCVGMI